MSVDEDDPWEDFLQLPGGNLFYQGYCQFFAGDDEVSVDLALHYFSRAVDKAKEVEGSFYPFNYYLGLAHEAKKNYEDAKTIFEEILDKFKPDEMHFKEIVKFYQPLQPSASEIQSEIDRLVKVLRGAPVHSLFIDRYRALMDEVNRQQQLSERAKDEERIRRREEEDWEEVEGYEVEPGKEVNIEVVGEELNEEILGDLNNHFWMNFEFVGDEVPGFGFYWSERGEGGTIVGSARIDENPGVLAAILKAVVAISNAFPDLKFYIECTEAEASVFGSEVQLTGGEWVFYKEQIAEFLDANLHD